MLTELTFVSAFVAGLLGATHCIGMCGGIVGALTMSLPRNVHQSYLRLWYYLLAYNLGRISSYTITGVFVGFLGAQFLDWLAINNSHLIIKWLSGVFMIALGLYLGEWWQALAGLERVGTHLWCKIEPYGRNFIPVKRPLQAFEFGIVWGWLPCGLVYSILAFSLASCDAWQGGMLMLAFGLGTLPASLALGATTPWLTRFARKLVVLRIIGAVVIMFGLFILFGSPDTLMGMK